jgi:hypothetical protein
MIASPSAAKAGPKRLNRLAEAKLADSPTEVLGGRLTVRMPQGAKTKSRPHDIMGAPESEEHETRIVLDAGPQRLVLMVEEQFALAGDDFENDVRQSLAKANGQYKVSPLALPAKRFKAVVITPVTDPDHSRNKDATFVEGMIVASDDHTIQSLDVYVNKAAEKDMGACKALAREILLSVVQGKKKLQCEAGQRRLSAFSKDLEISANVDKNTVATTQEGPDFLVHRLVVLGKLGADSDSVGIYVGNHPHATPGAKRGSGTVFGQKVDWHASGTDKNGLETLCELPIPGEEHLLAHVWVHGTNDAQLAAMKRVAETLELVKTKKASKSDPSGKAEK